MSLINLNDRQIIMLIKNMSIGNIDEKAISESF